VWYMIHVCSSCICLFCVSFSASENGAIVAIVVAAYGALHVVFVPCAVIVCYFLSDVMQ